MNKWLVYVGGIITGIVLMFVFLFFVGKSYNNKGITWFDKPGDTMEIKSFKVFQVIDKDAALVYGSSQIDISGSSFNMYNGAVYLLVNEDGKYYYDDEIIEVPDGKVARQVGIYKYSTKNDFEKTVPIVQITSK